MPLLKLSSIAIVDRQRKTMDPVALSELADSINLRGLLHAIVVRQPLTPAERATGKPYILAVGGRRCAAHLLLGRDEIEAKIKEDITDPVEARLVELEENLRRANISWDEETNARAEITELLISRGAKNQTEVASVIGVSASQLGRDITLAKMVKEDPTLKAAKSRGSAYRAATFKADMTARAAAVIQNRENVDLQTKIVTADARDFLTFIPRASIDLVFSDLPYGIDYFDVRAGATEITKGQYDDDAQQAKNFIADIIPHCLRVVKPTGWIVFFMCYEWHQWLQEQIRNCCLTHGALRVMATHGSARSYCQHGIELDSCSFLSPEMPPWIWTRRGAGNHGHWPELHASNRYEILVVVNGGSAKLTKKPVENVLDFPPFSGERLHEMQKPHELCQEIISRTTLPGEKVLDICFGSGAHLAAAASLNRDFIGCDNNPRNLASALTLVAQHYNAAQAATIARARGSAGPSKVGPRKVEDQLETTLELLKDL